MASMNNKTTTTQCCFNVTVSRNSFASETKQLLQQQQLAGAHALLNCCHLLANIDISPTSINIKLGERKEIQKTELKQKCEVPALSTGLWVSEPWTAADSRRRVPN